MTTYPNGQGSPAAAIPVYSVPCLSAPRGYQQITSLSVSTALTVPAGTTFAVIAVEGAAVRYRDDGIAPTAAIGMPLAIGATLTYAASLSAVRFIQQAASAILNVSYY